MSISRGPQRAAGPWRGDPRVLAGYAISLVLLLLLLRSVDLGALSAAIRQADFRLLPLAVGFYFVGLLLRSLRWALLLPPGAASLPTLFRALVVGFTVNNLLPARLGELARAYLLNRWAGVAYGTTLASVVVERVLDGLSLVLLLLVALALVPAPPYLLGLGASVGVVFVVLSLLLALAAWRPHLLQHVVVAAAERLPTRGGKVLVRLAAGFLEGLRAMRGGGTLLRLAALSLLGWLAELSLFYIIMLGFPIPATFPLAVLSGTSANFATLIPSSPGYVGTFESVLVKVLSETAALPADLATAYALVVHAALFFPVTLVGAFLLWRARLSFGQVARLSRRASVPIRGRQETPASAPADAR